MRMNQDERRFDFHGLGAALKRAREEKGWTQAYVAELVDRDSRTIMNIENKGQYPSFDLFVKLITMFDVSVDQFIHADGGARSSSCRKHIDVLLNSMNEKELVVIEATAEGIKLRPAQQRAHFRLCSPVQFKVGLMLRKEFPAVLRRLILLKDWAVAGHDLIAAILTGTDNSGLGHALVLDAGHHSSHFFIVPDFKGMVLEGVEHPSVFRVPSERERSVPLEPFFSPAPF